MFLQLVRQGVEIGPTDKNYKVYVRTQNMPNGKFYFQHLSAEQRNEFIELVNTNTAFVGYPGHFYVTPYFMRVAEAQ